MILKRIISCCSMISVALAISCYDVQYDAKKDVQNNTQNDTQDGENTETSDEDWIEGLTPQQIVEGMDVTAIAVNDDLKVFKVIWILPTPLEGTWSLKSCTFGENDSENWETLTDQVSSEAIASGVKYSFYNQSTWYYGQYLITYKICLTDKDGTTYENVVSFLILPANGCIRIKIDPASQRQTEKTSLYGFWLTKEWYTYWNVDYYWSSISLDSDAVTIVKDKASLPVCFKIISEMTDKGLGIVTHYSNSSFCRIERLSKAADASDTLATFKFSFEDLPINQLRYETTRSFDYNDVIYTVEILK